MLVDHGLLRLASSESVQAAAALDAWISEQRTMRDIDPPGSQGTPHHPGPAATKNSDGAYYDSSATKKQARREQCKTGVRPI